MSVVGRDAYTDLAVVAVDDLPATARPLPVAAEVPAPGAPVAALGNPMGLDGRVVGVNRARSGDNIGFAVSPAVAEANGRLEEPRGVLVVDGRDGPASGVLRGCTGSRRVRGREIPVGGDVIVGLDGVAVRSHQALLGYLLLETEPGTPVSVELLRVGRRLVETITLGERPDPTANRGRHGRSRGRSRGRGSAGGGHHVPID